MLVSAERPLRASVARLTSWRVWGHLETVSAGFQSGQAFSAAKVRCDTVRGLFDNGAGMLHLRGCAVLFLLTGSHRQAMLS